MVGFYKAIGTRSLATGLLASLVWVSGDGLTQLRVLAQPAWQVSLSFPESSGNRPVPQRTLGAGSRGTRGTRGSSCLFPKKDAPAMVALIPTNNIGTTATANPSLSVYLPQTTAQLAEVVIKEVSFDSEDFKEVYVKSDFKIPAALKEQAGIVTLKLEGVNLEPNKLYKWSFAAICNRSDRSQDEAIWGFFQHQELDKDSIEQIESAAPLERARLYAKAGIWNEALAIAASLRASNPQEWTELLQSVELEEIASAPLFE